MGQLDGLPEFHRPLIGRFVPCDHPEKRGLAGTVCADDANDGPRGNAERKILEQKVFVVGLGDVFDFNHFGAKSGPLGHQNFNLGLVALAPLIGQLFVAFDPGFVFGLPSGRAFLHPFQFAFERFLSLGFTAFFDFQTLALLLEPSGVIAFPRNAFSAIEFQNPARHVVQEVPVVGDGDDGPFVLGEMLLQPVHAFGVEVVGGFIEQKDGGLLQQQTTEGHPSSFTTRELVHRSIGGWATQGFHGHVQPGIKIPSASKFELFLQVALLLEKFLHLFGRHLLGELLVDGVVIREHLFHVVHAFFHNFEHGPGFTGQGFLFEVPDGIAASGGDLAFVFGVDTSHNFEQGGFARPVESQDADLRAVVERKRDIFDDLFAVDGLGDAHHGINDLRIAHDAASRISASFSSSRPRNSYM